MFRISSDIAVIWASILRSLALRSERPLLQDEDHCGSCPHSLPGMYHMLSGTSPEQIRSDPELAGSEETRQVGESAWNVTFCPTELLGQLLCYSTLNFLWDLSDIILLWSGNIYLVTPGMFLMVFSVEGCYFSIIAQSCHFLRENNWDQWRLNYFLLEKSTWQWLNDGCRKTKLTDYYLQ